jgi:alkylation response protein AidB-like acyl-CoA dehydrogenase
MDFEFTSDQIELRDNARAVLASACPVSLVRDVFEGKDDGGAAKLWATLLELGWPAIGIPEADGGIGLSFVETGLVVEELARVVAPSPFLATVTQFAPLVREAGAAGSPWLAKVAAGELRGALVRGEMAEKQEGSSYRLMGRATHVFDAASADEIVVAARGGVFVVPAAEVKIEPTKVIDPTMPMATVYLNDVRVDGDRVLLEPGDPRGPVAVERAMGETITAMALSCVATCRVIFETTLEYAKVREQFGKPIGSFQALKHRFARMYLEVEKASALAYFAALTIAEDDERRATAPSMAKAAASQCQRLVVTDGLQLHGGIGFTWENDLHFWLKRAKSCDFAFGGGPAHRAWLADAFGLNPDAKVLQFR